MTNKCFDAELLESVIFWRLIHNFPISLLSAVEKCRYSNSMTKLEAGLCLSAVGVSLLFVILGLVSLFTDNRVLMLIAALFLGLSILLTIGLAIYTGFFQKSAD